MIVLDTNVVSEAMKPTPDAAVLAWLDAQVSDTLFLTSVTIAELLFGIGSLPAGRRKSSPSEVFEGLAALFEGRVLDFDTRAGRHYADIAIKARASGKGFPLPDGYIAAIAARHGYAVATRDTSPFAAAGLKVINPWTA